MNAAERYKAAISACGNKNTWQPSGSFTWWGEAMGLTPEEVYEDVRAAGGHYSLANIRRSMATARQKMDARGATYRYGTRTRPIRTWPMPKPPPSRVVEECVDEGRKMGCHSSADLMTLLCGHGEDVRSMGMAEQRVAQFRAMFDHPDLRAFYVGIVPHKDSKWFPQVGHDWMTIGDWLADGARRVADSRGELVKINPFTGESEDRGDGREHLWVESKVATFPHVIMEFDDMSLPDQCAFWYGAITRQRLPVVSLVFSGGRSIHGVVRVDCGSRDEFKLAVARAKRVFASSVNGSMRACTNSLPSPIAGTRLAGCRRGDTGYVQRLLFLAKQSDTASQAANPAPPANMTSVPQTASPRDPYVPFDELLDACEVYEHLA